MRRRFVVINIKSVLRLHVVDFYAQRYSIVWRGEDSPVADVVPSCRVPGAAHATQGVTREQRSKFRRGFATKSKSKKQTKNPPSSPNPSIARSPPTPTIPTPLTCISPLHFVPECGAMYIRYTSIPTPASHLHFVRSAVPRYTIKLSRRDLARPVRPRLGAFCCLLRRSHRVREPLHVHVCGQRLLDAGE